MTSSSFTMVDEALFTSPAYASLDDTSARVLDHVVRYLKRTYRQGRLNESALGWIVFCLAMLPFKVTRRAFYMAIAALELAGFIDVLRSPGRPYRIAMSLRWRASGVGNIHCTRCAQRAQVLARERPDPDPETRIKTTPSGARMVPVGQVSIQEKTPEGKPRPPRVDVDALCVSLGDVAGVEGRDNVRRAIAGKPRSLIVRAWKSVMASKGVRCHAALFIYRLKDAWVTMGKTPRATDRHPCNEPVALGSILRPAAPRVPPAAEEPARASKQPPPVEPVDIEAHARLVRRQLAEKEREELSMLIA